MKNVAGWTLGIIIVISICAVVGAFFVYFRAHEAACFDYTYNDAVEYVKQNLGKSTKSSSPPRDNFWSKATVCMLQPQRGGQISDGPYIIDICDAQSGSAVGHAEVYSDCGLEWRRH